MSLLKSRIHSNSPLALKNSLRTGAALVSNSKDALHSSVGSGDLVGYPVRFLYCYSVMSEEIDRLVGVTF